MEDVKTDCKTNTVVVKGKAAAQDPKNVAETIYRRSGKRVLEILSPAPGPHLLKNVAVVEMLEKKKEEKTNQKKEVLVPFTIYDYSSQLYNIWCITC